MFQTSDDLNFDEEFLKDAFDVPFANTESNKRNSDPLNDQPIKKVCTTDTNTENILSIIKSKSQTKPDTSFVKPRTPLPHKNFTNQEKNRRVVQRKFPGPAGILPEQKISIKTFEEFEESTKDKTLERDEIVCSQFSEDIFKQEPWLKMLSDWSAVHDRISLPNKYTISWTKSKAVAKKLIGQKTPFLAAVIQTIDSSSKDPMVLLKDKTGEIQATLLHEAWEEYCDYLTSGSVIVLKQVSILSTLKKHYLAITLNNIVTIYSEETNEMGKTVETTNVQELTVEDFIKTIEDTKQSHSAQKVLQKLLPATNNPYFKQLNPQKSPEIKTKPVMKNIINSEVNKTPNTFNFKSFSNKVANEQSKENNLSVVQNVNIATTSENSTKSADETLILTQMLEGVDTDSLFEDF